MGTGPQYRSARRFTRPSPLYRAAAGRGELERTGYALVFGAGQLVEAGDLRELGWWVDALETRESIARREKLYAEFASHPRCRVLSALEEGRSRYRLILVTHVLEFVEDKRSRRRYLQELASRLTDNGQLLLSLRGWRDVTRAKKQEARGDGIVTGIGTWVRGYTMEEAQDLIKAAGLRIEWSMHGRRSRNPEQVRVACVRT